MSRSSKGTAEQPGKKVSQKSSLNRAILDQGWGEFRRQLGYKVEWNGGILLAVPQHHTSQTCPCCGHISKDNRQTQVQFLCVDCGYKNHADVVGASYASQFADTTHALGLFMKRWIIFERFVRDMSQ